MKEGSRTNPKSKTKKLPMMKMWYKLLDYHNCSHLNCWVCYEIDRYLTLGLIKNLITLSYIYLFYLVGYCVGSTVLVIDPCEIFLHTLNYRNAASNVLRYRVNFRFCSFVSFIYLFSVICYKRFLYCVFRLVVFELLYLYQRL